MFNKCSASQNRVVLHREYRYNARCRVNFVVASFNHPRPMQHHAGSNDDSKASVTVGTTSMHARTRTRWGPSRPVTRPRPRVPQPRGASKKARWPHVWGPGCGCGLSESNKRTPGRHTAGPCRLLVAGISVLTTNREVDLGDPCSSSRNPSGLAGRLGRTIGLAERIGRTVGLAALQRELACFMHHGCQQLRLSARAEHSTSR